MTTVTSSGTTLAPAGTSSRRMWMPRGVLAFTMLATGAAGLIYEYVLSTVLSYLLGNSIEQFSITIGVMFAMMGIGGFLQKVFRSHLAELFIGAELLLVLVGGFSPIVLQWAYAMAPDDFGWIKFIYTCLIGFLVGVEIPLIMRINERFTTNLGSNIAGTWAWDYIGGAVGVIAWLFLLHRFVPITSISFIVAGFNLAVALLSFAFFWKRGLLQSWTTRLITLVGAVTVTAAVTIGYLNAGTWSGLLLQRLYDDPISFATTTKYQNIVMTQGPHPTDPSSHNYQLWLNGNKQFSSVDEKIYHEYLVHPAMNLAARHEHVLILGGGDGLALREILKYPDVKDVTMVDLDPEMIKLARTNTTLRELNGDSLRDARVTSNLDDATIASGIEDSGKTQQIVMETDEENRSDCAKPGADDCVITPKTQNAATVEVYTIDADRFLSGVKGRWDVVIVDLPDPNSIELAKLYSQEFYMKVKQKLNPDGMVVVQSTSPYHSKETFLCILRTMAAAGLGTMPYHDNVPSFGDWGWVMGSPSLDSTQVSERATALSSFTVHTDAVGPDMLRRAMIFELDGLKPKSKRISRVMEPVVFDLYVYEGWKVE